uniref:Uncharacterized protein n=1 Tax=Branchiostoma floridae TaxID=7739 RepID=C3ZGE5_BRAFL|eukprot:XP_002592378.1 hypothetical protein BRAFLDRAFT_67239 [Branchiostoma floridae]
MVRHPVEHFFEKRSTGWVSGPGDLITAGCPDPTRLSVINGTNQHWRSLCQRASLQGITERPCSACRPLPPQARPRTLGRQRARSTLEESLPAKNACRVLPSGLARRAGHYPRRRVSAVLIGNGPDQHWRSSCRRAPPRGPILNALRHACNTIRAGTVHSGPVCRYFVRQCGHMDLPDTAASFSRALTARELHHRDRSRLEPETQTARPRLTARPVQSPLAPPEREKSPDHPDFSLRGRVPRTPTVTVDPSRTRQPPAETRQGPRKAELVKKRPLSQALGHQRHQPTLEESLPASPPAGHYRAALLGVPATAPAGESPRSRSATGPIKIGGVLTAAVPIPPCPRLLGMESGAIPDGRITASSVFASGFEPYCARLNRITGGGAWVAKTNAIGEWLQIFLGNVDMTIPVTNLLDNPVDARYVRFLPQSWYRDIAMRVEIVGCNTTLYSTTKHAESGTMTCDLPKAVSLPLIFEVKVNNSGSGLIYLYPWDTMENQGGYHIKLSSGQSQIGRTTRDEETVDIVASCNSADLTSAEEFRRFWICWSKGGSVGVGRAGEVEPFMSWTDPHPATDLRKIGYGTWAAPGVFMFNYTQDGFPGLCVDPPTQVNTTGPVCDCPYLQGENCTYPCDPGYQVNSGDVITRTCAADGSWIEPDVFCQDIDECLTLNGGCSWNCTNTVGSYNCSCEEGFALDIDGHNCTEFDEWSTQNGGCSQFCTNTFGSYHCSCGEMFLLDSDGHSCTSCPHLLGKGSSDIPDYTMTASSGYGPNGRLNSLAGGGAWFPSQNVIGEWLQVDLGETHHITGSMIQGRHNVRQYVRSYKLKYSEDGISWTTYGSSYAPEKVFGGIYELLSNPIDARYVRFYPQSWYGRIAMRVGVLGCNTTCSDPLGMGSGTIPDSSITAPSYLNEGYLPRRGRLNLVGYGGAWAPRYTSVGQWLEVFPGNVDRTLPVTNLLDHPVDARYVRFLPQSWNGRMTMRVEIIGCPSCSTTRHLENGTLAWDLPEVNSSPFIFEVKVNTSGSGSGIIYLSRWGDNTTGNQDGYRVELRSGRSQIERTTMDTGRETVASNYSTDGFPGVCVDPPTQANTTGPVCDCPYLLGENCTYPCSPGYHVTSGNVITRTCTENGSWTEPDLFCHGMR